MGVRIVHEYEGTVHPKIQIVENERVRYLRFGDGGGWQGALNLSGSRLVFPYQRAFAALLRATAGLGSFLSLGVGTGTALRTVRSHFPACRLYGVEVDERVVEAAIRHFGAPTHADVTYWIGDGVALLCYTDFAVDMVFVDAYMATQVYAPCLDPGFPAVLHAATGSAGIVVCNLITSFPLRGPVRTFLTAAAREFPVGWLLPLGPPVPFWEQNVLAVFAHDAELGMRWQSALRTAGDDLYLLERWLWPRRLRSVQTSLDPAKCGLIW